MEKIVEASPEWLRPLILTAYYKDGVIYLPSTKTLKDLTGRGQMVG